VLPVMEGRSYTASIEMLGNAQVYPMQFFFLENSPLFGGLYQVMKVKHSITPNNMITNVDGMRMRFCPNKNEYGSIAPITIETYERLGDVQESGKVNLGFTANEVTSMRNASSLPSGSDGGDVYTEEPSPRPSQKQVIDLIIKYANQAGIKDKNRLFCLLVVAKKECGFIPQSEDPYYSLSGARATFGLNSLSDEEVKKLLTPAKGGTGQVDSLFNYVYGKKYGNDGYTYDAKAKKNVINPKFVGPYTDGKDGYRYRGRGITQITFKGGYKKMQENIKKYYPDSTENILEKPELVNQLEYAIKSLIVGKITQQFGAFNAKIDFLNSPEAIHRSNHGTSKTKPINQKTFKGTKKAFYYCKTDSYIQSLLSKFPDYA
jgi:predicted chitinase